MSTQEDFFDAVFSDNTALAKELHKKGARVGEDEILHCAAQSGKVEMLSLLLQIGGKEFIDQFDSLSFTPLTWAAKRGHVAAVKLLLQAGANINAVDTENIGNSALREVVGDGNLEIIELLLNSGADPHLPGWMQMTAVDKARIQWQNSKSPRGRKILELLNSRQTKAEKILSLAKARKHGEC
jgi:ankyrin repeat protein